MVERSKYYAVWTLTEVCVKPDQSKASINLVSPQGASILTGLGFNGFKASGEPRWNGAANVKPMEIEFPSNFKVLFDSWNMNTNIWLRECVYKRVTPKGRKPGNRSQMLTFATSAFWVRLSVTTFCATAPADMHLVILIPSSSRQCSWIRHSAWYRWRLLPHVPHGWICDISCPSSEEEFQAFGPSTIGFSHDVTKKGIRPWSLPGVYPPTELYRASFHASGH